MKFEDLKELGSESAVKVRDLVFTNLPTIVKDINCLVFWVRDCCAGCWKVQTGREKLRCERWRHYLLQVQCDIHGEEVEPSLGIPFFHHYLIGVLYIVCIGVVLPQLNYPMLVLLWDHNIEFDNMRQLLALSSFIWESLSKVDGSELSVLYW